MIHSIPLLYKVVFLVTFVLFSIDGIAQDKIYYDEFFKSVSEKKTSYYREFVNQDSVVRFTEICSDTILAKGSILSGSHPDLVNDFAHFIKSYGNPYQFKQEFSKMRGEVDFYKDGVLYSRIVSHSGKMFHGQIWSPDGKELLTLGNGENVTSDKTSTFHQFFKDSVMVEMFEVRNVERDTLYYTYDKLAEPRNGYAAFSQELAKILKYPGFARLVNKEGLVYIRFIIDKDGKLSELTPLSDKGFNLEKNAIKKLSKMPNWNPATFRGKPVKMRFTLPIRFRLT